MQFLSFCYFADSQRSSAFCLPVSQQGSSFFFRISCSLPSLSVLSHFAFRFSTLDRGKQQFVPHMGDYLCPGLCTSFNSIAPKAFANHFTIFNHYMSTHRSSISQGWHQRGARGLGMPPPPSGKSSSL